VSQVEAVASLVKNVGESVLFTCLERERRKNPDAEEHAHIRVAAKKLVPHTVPGSPAFHRAALQDLLAIVHAKGVPSLFLTLTADESSDMRWTDVDALEGVLRSVAGNGDFGWVDMPVEMARHFHDRVQNFIKDHLLDPSNPILGKITNYTLRYESQVRTCLLLLRVLWCNMWVQPTSHCVQFITICMCLLHAAPRLAARPHSAVGG
jgi:hypothetical protein